MNMTSLKRFWNRKQWITNQDLHHYLYGPPKYLIISVLATFLVMQLVYYSIDIHNFSKYFGYRGDFIGKEDFITYLYKMDPRSSSDKVIVTIGSDLRYGPKLMSTITNKNYTKPLASLSPIFADSDINILGLDGPITDSETKRTCSWKEKDLNRCCTNSCFWKQDPSIVPALKDLGINGLVIENDHIFDYGREGVEDTLYQLREAKIPYAGMGYRILYNVKGCNVTVLNYNWAYQGDDVYEKMKDMLIYDLKTTLSDTVIVMMHGGNQNGGDKTVLQEEFAKVAIDNGASIVIGSHSRVRQETEMYKDKKIYYGLGSIMDENMLGKDASSFSLVQFEITQCKNIINLHEIKAKKDLTNMEVSVVKN